MSISGVYRHFKGSYYEVVGVATDMGSGEEFILYRQMYDVFGYWMRPKNMFFGSKMTEKGPVERFEKVGELFANSIKTEDIETLTFGHTETQQRYKIDSLDFLGDDYKFQVKPVE